MNDLLRQLPQISKVIERFRGTAPENLIKKVARQVIEKYRREIKEGKRKSLEGLYPEIEREIEKLKKPRLRRVINATGIVINTNLGRSPLHPEALEAIKEVALGYSNLEYDLEKGTRGNRNAHIEEILCELTGSESAFVVNNNAGAVYLVLNTLALDREVVISRGELVEIGGSFRIPDIMSRSGSILREVGTTNKTRLKDYEEAIGENTALLMKVHRSNFYMEGFVEEVPIKELSKLAKEKGIPLYYDAGSGLIHDLKNYGLDEPSFSECLSQGADIVSGSGDKLLGGPQAGIILGKKELIERIKKNPMSRALRIDKLTLSALEATLRLYAEGRYSEIPALNMILQDEKTIKKRALKLKRKLSSLKEIEVSILKDRASPGGGSLPKLELPTYCVAITHPELSPDKLSELLRNSDPPLIGRVKEGKLLLDLRTVRDHEIDLIPRSISQALRDTTSSRTRSP